MSNHEQERESYILFVGEGDFSFSANYIAKSKGCYEKVYASCLTDQPLTDRQLKNRNIITENGGLVFTDVDATQLEYHPAIKDVKFSKIIFNFPHIAGKMNIRKNRQLIEKFFLSSKNVLKDYGVLIVTLCQGQGGTDIEKVKRKWSDTWQIVSLAASASFILYRIQPFNAYEFDSYQCTGFRGLQKPFKTEGALTHIFTLGSPVCFENDITKSYFDATFYLQNVEHLLKNIHCNPYHPCGKVSDILSTIAQEVFHSIHHETICDLLTCIRLPLVNFDIDCIDINFCKNCMSHLISLLLLKKNSQCITSIQCTICCIKNICINSFPFCYLQIYFSNNRNFLTNLPMFFKYLKQLCVLNTHSLDPSVEINPLQGDKVLQYVPQCSDKKIMSVKSIFSLYASYSICQGEEFFFYSDVQFFLSENSASKEIKSDVFKLGSVLQINENVNSYFCILLDINILSQLKYHIMDYRILLSESSFYSSQVLNGISVDLYRSFSLYPPTFVHDVSFYTNQDFNENDLFLVVKNAVGHIIKSISLIDSYYNSTLQKHSRCYRFVYQSYDKVLSKSQADYIHTKFVRKVLENSLNITLR